ncbi:MAG: fatty acid desaturase CarF family protein [Pirellulales bacterium]
MIEFLLFALQLLGAYAAADAAGGLFHLATDHGYNFPRVVRNFLNHHERPWTMTFDLEPLLLGLPLIFVGLGFSSTFLILLGVFTGLSQLPHYFTHHPAPAWVQLLQRLRIFLPPKKHDAHHNGVYDRNYCVLAGWSDWWINWIAARLPKPAPYFPVL